ncbi:hypothetical protein B0H17DRAFT_1186259 [Mycena rosella]|uniref:Uncharacterized protein n=1 Tax=Mycena rosella TaxID=1033263 RepID=A0AAD7G4D3_MYCRO|nr:hypothetical protein B0H17DRAFT_1186259 [Mycena rosella]
MYTSGVVFRIMAANPWVVVGASLADGIGSMFGVFYTPPENTIQKHFFWLTFNVFQATTLSPLFFLNLAILARTGFYTLAVVGTTAVVPQARRPALGGRLGHRPKRLRPARPPRHRRLHPRRRGGRLSLWRPGCLRRLRFVRHAKDPGARAHGRIPSTR